MVGLATDAAGSWRDADDEASDSDSDTAAGQGADAEGDLSPDDAAWVDSCLVKDDDPDRHGGEDKGEHLPDDAWDALTEAFVNALAYSASAAATNVREGGTVHEYAGGPQASAAINDAPGEDELMSPADADASTDQVEASSPTASTFYVDPPSLALGDSYSPSSSAGDRDGPSSSIVAEGSGTDGGFDAAAVVIGSEYRPEAEEERGYGEEEDDGWPKNAVGEVEQTSDIFRVWELELPEVEEEEEGVLGWQLRKAMEGSSVGAMTSVPAAQDLDGWKMEKKPSAAEAAAVLVVEEDDDDDQENLLKQVLAGINDLSLAGPPSSSTQA